MPYLKLLINIKTITWIYTTEMKKKRTLEYILVIMMGYDEHYYIIKAMGPFNQGTEGPLLKVAIAWYFVKCQSA